MQRQIRGPPHTQPQRGPSTQIVIDKQQPLAVLFNHDERITIRRRHDL